MTNFCPKNAHLFAIEALTDRQAQDWCRRVAKPSSELCAECELGRKLGVVVCKVEVEHKVQGRLF
jgi:hypothetical protein